MDNLLFKSAHTVQHTLHTDNFYDIALSYVQSSVGSSQVLHSCMRSIFSHIGFFAIIAKTFFKSYKIGTDDHQTKPHQGIFMDFSARLPNRK